MPSAMAVASGQRAALDLYGDTFGTEDGTAVRDFIHCWDVASATSQLLLQSLAGSLKEILNVSSGKGCSMAEVIAAAERVTGRRVPVIRHAAREGELARLVLSPERLARFGFAPRYSDLQTILASAWTWYAPATRNRGSSAPAMGCAIAPGALSS
jgi:UDP-glucose 4-epimerase